jgi:hypothetical protein
MTDKIYEWHTALSLNRRLRQLIPRTTLLRWIGEKKLKTYGHRGAAFAFDPADIERLEMLGISFSKMSKPLGVTRSALSKMGLAIRAEFNLTSRGAKSERARSLYAAAQHRVVAKGTHASLKWRDLRPRRKR